MKNVIKWIREETSSLGSDKSTFGKWRLLVLSLLRDREILAQESEKLEIVDAENLQKLEGEARHSTPSRKVLVLSYLQRNLSVTRSRIMIRATQEYENLEASKEKEPYEGYLENLIKRVDGPNYNRFTLTLLWVVIRITKYIGEIVEERLRKIDLEGTPKKPHRAIWERSKPLSEFWLMRLPHWTRRGEKKKKILRCNRYLAFQERALKKAVKEGKLDKATKIWMSLIQKSYSYQLATFNRLVRGWYWRFSEDYTRKQLAKLVKKCREFNLGMSITRKYVIKSKVAPERHGLPWGPDTKLLAGEKLRPIGHPDVPSRAMSKMINDLIYRITSGNRLEMQHGYRKDLGVHSALKEVISKLRQGYSCYEFDLKSFFNTVPREEIKQRLTKVGGRIMADLVDKVMIEIQYRNIENLQAEKELKLYGKKKIGKKEVPIIIRSGMPQGLPISPVVSTLVLEQYGPPKNLVMYADDGVLLYLPEEKESVMEQFNKWTKNLSRRGIRIEPEKSGEVRPYWKDGKLIHCFKFLGVWLDLKHSLAMFRDRVRTKQYPEGKEHYIRWSNPKLNEWLKKAPQWYGSQNDKWSWEVKIDSIINRVEFDTMRLDSKERAITWWTSALMNSNPWKGYRYFVGPDNEGLMTDLKKYGLRKWVLVSRYLESVQVKTYKWKWWGFPANWKREEGKGSQVGETSEWQDGRFYDISSSSTIGCELLLKERVGSVPTKRMSLEDIIRETRKVKEMESNKEMKWRYSSDPNKGWNRHNRNNLPDKLERQILWNTEWLRASEGEGDLVDVRISPWEGLMNHRKGYYEIIQVPYQETVYYAYQRIKKIVKEKPIML